MVLEARPVEVAGRRHRHQVARPLQPQQPVEDQLFQSLRLVEALGCLCAEPALALPVAPHRSRPQL